MSKKLYPEENIQAIANAIRALNGSSDTYAVGDMADAIELPENGYYLKESTAANPLSITDGEELNAQSCIVEFEPVQEGSGDPSPENVRPFVLWDKIRVGVAVNEFYTSANTVPYNSSTTTVDILNNNSIQVKTFSDASYPASKQNLSYYNLVNGKKYTVYAYAEIKSGTARIGIRNSSGTNIATSTTISQSGPLKLTFEMSNDAKVLSLFCNFASPATGNVIFKDIRLSEGEMDVNIVAFDEPVAGGKFDFASGKEKSEWVYAEYDGTENWSVSDLGQSTQRFTLSVGTLGIGGTVNPICDKMTYSGNAGEPFGYFRLNSTKTTLVINDGNNAFETLDDFETWLSTNKLSFVYPLATPQEITLPPETIELLKDNNVFTTDGKTVKVRYLSKHI